MSFLNRVKSLFSTEQESPQEEAILYKECRIVPAPQKEGGQFRVAAVITKGEGEEQKVHQFIRSDLIPSRDECLEVTIRKAKQSIDQLGDSLFG